MKKHPLHNTDDYTQDEEIHDLKSIIESLENEIEQLKQQSILSAVGKWLRFEDATPIDGQEILIVWETYPPEKRIWTQEDADKDWSTLRWLAIPNWKQ